MNVVYLSMLSRIYAKMVWLTRADPGFEKGGGALVSWALLKTLGDFLKNLGQKGVGVRPPPLDPHVVNSFWYNCILTYGTVVLRLYSDN